ncbi:hypothetical protein EJ110_NYTH22160 [Nymphaea thermarum]|nr:hypothetical protein EJ110_NYTH22160 [Nymphaea thermarum]
MSQEDGRDMSQEGQEEEEKEEKGGGGAEQSEEEQEGEKRTLPQEEEEAKDEKEENSEEEAGEREEKEVKREVEAEEDGGGEEDYVELKDLHLDISKSRNRGEEGALDMKDDGSFTLCLWIYFLGSSQYPASIINQASSDGEVSMPFLKLNGDKKITLMPAILVHEEAYVDEAERPCVSAELECPFEKWVHVGCEVGTTYLRLHIDGEVVNEKQLSHSSVNDSALKLTNITLVGTAEADNSLHGYVHHACVYAFPSVKDHYVKNPPLMLSLDGSSCLSENIEVVEGGDGVWSVVGGKASCRRNFALDILLLDALGHSAQREIEVIASLVYADNGLPVEKSKDDAEAPLLTTYDGVEFPSTDRPIKLLHGRASFKLKISQLSSKCENRLFRVRFESSNEQRYPFLVVYSRPIRCVSRNRNARPLSVWRKPFPAAHLPDVPPSPGADEGSSEIQDGDEHFLMSTLQGSVHGPLHKRAKVGHGRIARRVGADVGLELLCEESNVWDIHPNDDDTAYKGKHGTKIGSNGIESIPSDCQSNHARVSAFSRTGSQLSDLAIFKYCLEGINERAAFLKEVVASATEQALADFASQVSIYTGCSHNRHQILIAKRLIQEGNRTWNLLSQNGHQVLWRNAIFEVERQFLRISQSVNRSLSIQDKEFLRGIAGCSETVGRESFDRLWQWLYPVALTLSKCQLHAAWECTSPKWVEGMITREEAESSLRGPQGIEKSGTFLLRFANSRSWPHPDAGSLVVSYVGTDCMFHHKLVSLDDREMNEKPLVDLLLSQPELSQLGRVRRAESSGGGG